MKEPIITLVGKTTGRILFKRVYSTMQQLDLKGSFLWDPPDLDRAYNYASACIDELHNSEKCYAHRPFLVERIPAEVSIVHVGAGNDKRTVVCLFKKKSHEK